MPELLALKELNDTAPFVATCLVVLWALGATYKMLGPFFQERLRASTTEADELGKLRRDVIEYFAELRKAHSEIISTVHRVRVLELKDNAYQIYFSLVNAHLTDLEELLRKAGHDVPERPDLPDALKEPIQ